MAPSGLPRWRATVERSDVVELAALEGVPASSMMRSRHLVQAWYERFRCRRGPALGAAKWSTVAVNATPRIC
ncbi:MAG: hypothetical protein R3B48_12955 [Kofleriaceae bacterium]